MTPELLPDIPRWYTGLAEWGAAVVYIQLARRRFGRATHLSLLAAGLPAMIALQLLVGLLPITLWMLGMATAVVAILGFILLLSDVSVRGAGYLAARSFVLAELVASLQWQLWVHWVPLPPTPALGAWPFIGSLGLLIACYAVSLAVALLVERRNFPHDERFTVGTTALVSTVAIAGATFFVSNLSFVATNTPFSGTTGLDIFYIRTLVDLAGFVALHTQQSHRTQVRREIALAETQMMMELQHEQFLQSKRNIDELNRMHHDLQYYAAAVRAEESAERRSEYLSDLEASIRGYESEIQTGNRLLDIILSAKMEKCLQDGITMTTVVDGRAVSFIDLPQLSALFGNALDNAIDACRRIEDPNKRLIRVSVFTQGALVMIRVENFYDRAVEFVRGLPSTTKRDRRQHGYGTRSMRRIVESLGGTIVFQHEADWFHVRILLPQPA
ncbi:GHKL domain-containing protein, partial [Microbacterium sp. gxy059]|uniref:sensor histidine kinase n=1 Tax=Microbacterium sp. gxy059 TaxID=2957199 RepID=UPI003D963393